MWFRYKKQEIHIEWKGERGVVSKKEILVRRKRKQEANTDMALRYRK